MAKTFLSGNNIMTIKPISECPNPLFGVYNPTKEMKYAAGYREVPEKPVLAEDNVRISETLVEGSDGVTGVWQVIDKPVVEILAEEAARSAGAITPYLPVMELYRTVLRRNFGDKAETNRTISLTYALNYFGDKVLKQTVTPQETADSVLLLSLHQLLAPISPTNLLWDLPWERLDK